MLRLATAIAPIALSGSVAWTGYEKNLNARLQQRLFVTFSGAVQAEQAEPLSWKLARQRTALVAFPGPSLSADSGAE